MRAQLLDFARQAHDLRLRRSLRLDVDLTMRVESTQHPVHELSGGQFRGQSDVSIWQELEPM
jgi:hypothetical protein